MVTVLGANSVTGGYDVENSLRFNSGSSDYLLRTHGTNNTAVAKFAFSFWIKRSKIGTEQVVLTAYTDGDNIGLIRFNATDVLEIYDYQDAYKLRKVTNRVFRDTSAWYHIVISSDATVGTPVLGLYINGVQETSFSTNTDYDQNDANMFNKNVLNWIAANPYNSGSGYTNGYISEFCFIDGIANDEEDFGEFDDSGIWKPIKVSGLTFGDNGYYLEFKQAGTSQNASGMGADTSGNTDHWAVASLTAVDQTTDTCTNNFSTLNPLYQQGDNAFSEGNCKVVLQAGDGTKGVASNIAVSSGKWYFEVKQGSSTNSVIQVREASDKEDDLSYYEGSYAGYQFNNGNQYITGNSSSAYGASYADGDIIMVALDMDNNRVYFGKNGSWNDGDGNADEANLNDYAPVNGVTNAIAAFTNANGSATATAEFNFGNPPYANSSSVSDGNGHGNFEFAVPSGYFAICTKNLAEHG